MAPVAAHLAQGAEPSDLGPVICDPLLLSIPFRAQAIRGGLRGQVIYVDRFGNLITNIHSDQLSKNRPSRVMIGHKFDLGYLRHAFAEVQAGQPLAYIGSSSFVEIAINRGSAAELFGVAADVTIRFR
jgi:S-adenosylmethionine hydrolase